MESLKQRSVNQSMKLLTPEGDSNVLMKKEKKKPQKVPSPKPTAVSLARMVWNGPIFNMLCFNLRSCPAIGCSSWWEKRSAENVKESKQHCDSTLNLCLHSKCYIYQKVHLTKQLIIMESHCSVKRCLNNPSSDLKKIMFMENNV